MTVLNHSLITTCHHTMHSQDQRDGCSLHQGWKKKLGFLEKSS